MYIVILLAILLSIFTKYRPSHTYRWDSKLLFILILMILCSGLRYMIGSDTVAYMSDYHNMPNFKSIINNGIDTSLYEPLWYFFCAFCKLFSDDYFFMQFVHAILVNSIIFNFIKKYTTTDSLYIAVLLYFICLFLYFNTEIMREVLAICVILMVIPSLLKKRYFIFYFGCIIASLFHGSALICAIIPLFIRIKNTKKAYIIMAIICACSSILWYLFQDYIYLAFFIQSVEHKYNAYIETEFFNYNVNGTILQIIIKCVLPLSIILINKSKEACAINKLLFPFVYIYIILGVFSLYNNTIFDRFQNYFAIPFWIYTANTFIGYNYKKIMIKTILVTSVFLMVIGRYYSYFKYDVTDTFRIYERYFPYSSVLNKKDSPSRKAMEDYHYY